MPMPNDEVSRFDKYIRDKYDQSATDGPNPPCIEWYKEFLIHEGREWPPEWVTANNPS